MIRPILLGAAFALATASFPAGIVRAEDQDVAMVLDVSGIVAPETEAFAMLPDGTRLVLGTDGEIELVHLANCELVRMKGGSVEVHTFGIDADGDELLRSEDECPEEARLSGETTTGGVTLRAGETVLVPDRPVLVLDRAIAGASISGPANTEALHHWMAGTRILRWPGDKPALTGKIRYQLTVAFPDGAIRHATLLVVPDGGQRSLPVILSSD